MKRIPTMLLAALLGVVGAGYAQPGYLSEIKMSFTNQTALLPPSPILTAGPSDGSYLICAYLEQGSADTVGATLAWTDENGNSQSLVLVPAGSGATSGCSPIRNKANTAPTIQAIGTFTASYSIYTVGFGFWNVGPDKQGGLTLPISADYPGQTSTLGATTLLFSDSYDTYLVTMTLTEYSALDHVTATLGWYDETGSHQSTLTGCHACTADQVFLIRVVPQTYVMLSTSGTVSDKYDLHVRGLKFGAPATGSGPLSFHGHSLLHWVNPASYDEGVVPAGMWLKSANAEFSSSTRTLTINGFPVTTTTHGTVPGSGVAAVYVPTAADERFYASCGGSRTCPLYSAEFDLVVF